MAGSSFKTNPIYLHQLLNECHRGIIQLPDFQRSWVWDEDRIKSLSQEAFSDVSSLTYMSTLERDPAQADRAVRSDGSASAHVADAGLCR